MTKMLAVSASGPGRGSGSGSYRAARLLEAAGDALGDAIEVEGWRDLTVQAVPADAAAPYDGRVDIEVSLDHGAHFMLAGSLTGAGTHVMGGAYAAIRARAVHVTGGAVLVLVAGHVDE